MTIKITNLFKDNQDILFHMEKMIDWDSSVPLIEEGF